MRKYRALISMLTLAIVLALGANAEGATVDRTGSVSATLSIAGQTSLSAFPSSIQFPMSTEDYFPFSYRDPESGEPEPQAIWINYTSNYNPWKIAIYTNNTQVPNAAQPNGRYTKGGLATADGKNIVACKWIATSGYTPSITTIGGYNFIKDKRDEDNIATTTIDESWTGAFSSGYPNIASGGRGGGNCVDPTDISTTDGDGLYVGDQINGSLAVYVAAMCKTGGVTPPMPGAAGSYNSNIYFDLYHE